MPVTHPKWKAERDWMEESMTEENSIVRYEQELWDGVAIESFKMYGLIEQSADHADAFMAERAKRKSK